MKQEDVPDGILSFGPGSVIVVGPNGRLALRKTGDQAELVTMHHCVLSGATDMPDEQRRFVDWAWAEHFDDLGNMTIYLPDP